MLEEHGDGRVLGCAVLAACWMALGLFQTAQVDPVRHAEITQAVIAVQAAAKTRDDASQTAEQRRRFEEKFNRLVSAMADFQREYNASGGHVWPRKQADALKKALKQLQLP